MFFKVPVKSDFNAMNLALLFLNCILHSLINPSLSSGAKGDIAIDCEASSASVREKSAGFSDQFNCAAFLLFCR